MAPVKDFRVGKEMQECTCKFSKQETFLETLLFIMHFSYTGFFSQEKDKEKSIKNLSKTCH